MKSPLVFAIFASVALSATTCYFPDGTEAANFTTCNAGAANAACCTSSDACLSNGYCLQQDGLSNRIIRGSCTDKTFDSSACPQQCKDVAPNVPISIYLAYDAEPQGNFCCRTAYNVTSNSCTTSTEDSTDPFQLSAGTVIYDRATGAQLPETWNDTTPVATVMTVTATPSAGAQKSSSNITAVAAGIAVPLGVLLLAALAGCGILWKQLQRAKRGQVTMAEAPAVPEKQHDGMYYGAATPNTGYDQYAYEHMAHRPELPVNDGIVAEAPTEREIPLADSRSIQK
ncbi:hypothetical protein HII31_10677 [Pseudocercospora fuligena]|uniref:Mid2 domain-containing protein n=1 Tax=Pseudocercospora fuligena TaxID=685502 RepID=A0A8H6VE60_9PEZI|nr:hypothetical protein HII31_10677 [Pseudocercospora fuligena]